MAKVGIERPGPPRSDIVAAESSVASSPGQTPPNQALRRMAGVNVTTGKLAPQSGAMRTRNAAAAAVAATATT